MAWVLRITNIVPISQRNAYIKASRRVIEALTQNSGIKHLGSYRVAFGHALEFMHLLEFESLVVYEDTHVPETCQEMKDLHSGLVQDSRWEWLKSTVK